MTISDLPDNIRKLYPFSHNESHHHTLPSSHKLHYIDSGNGLPTVMLHGHPTWSFYYRNVIQALNHDFRCIAIDHLGCGLSDKPQNFDYTLHNHIQNAIHLIDHLNLDKFNLIVHDWGGAIGMGLAQHFQSRVNRIVLLNTAAFRSPHIPLRINLCRVPGLGKFLIRGLNAFVRAANFMASTQPLPKAAKQAYVFPFNNWNNRIASHQFVADIPMSPSHRSYNTLVAIENNLPQLANIPIMLCWGGKDFCFNDHFFKEWQTRFPNAQAHYFKDSGHYVLEDAHHLITPLVQNFFDSNN